MLCILSLSYPELGYKREKLSGNEGQRTKQQKVHVQQEQHSKKPQRVKIATLLQFRDVIEPTTLANLLSYQAQGKDFVYVESDIVEKLRSLHIDKKNGKNKKEEKEEKSS